MPAPKGPVAATAMLKRTGQERLGPELPQRLPARFRRRPVDGEDAVQVVDLVLEHSRLQPLGLDGERLSLRRERLEGERLRSLDRDDHGGGSERETTLVLGDPLLGRGGDLRVDQRYRRLLLSGLVDQHAPQDADLGSGKAHPVSLVHEVRHPLDQGREPLVRQLDLLRAHAQHRVRVLADLRQRSSTPSFLLGVEGLVPYLSFDLAHGG